MGQVKCVAIQRIKAGPGREGKVYLPGEPLTLESADAEKMEGRGVVSVVRKSAPVEAPASSAPETAAASTAPKTEAEKKAVRALKDKEYREKKKAEKASAKSKGSAPAKPAAASSGQVGGSK